MVIQKAGNPAFCFIKKRWKEVKKLATKLKNLHIRKVDFVDEGANQRADIKIAKKKDADPEADIPVRESTMKKFMRAIGKAVGITDDYLDALEDVQKGNSQTFGEKMTEVKRQKVADEMWSICYALQSSLQSILYDEDLDGATAQSMMEKSVSEFDEIIGESISSWSAGKISGIKKDIGINDIESLKKFRDHLDENIEKALNSEKGENEEMATIDKSKMSPEDRAAYEDILHHFTKHGLHIYAKAFVFPPLLVRAVMDTILFFSFRSWHSTHSPISFARIFSLFFLTRSCSGNSRFIASSPTISIRLSFIKTGVFSCSATATIFRIHSGSGMTFPFLRPVSAPIIIQSVCRNKRLCFSGRTSSKIGSMLTNTLRRAGKKLNLCISSSVVMVTP